MTQQNPLNEIPDDEWEEFEQEAMGRIEPRMRRLRGAPDAPQDIYNSAWRTFLERRNSGNPKYWKDVFSNSLDYIKLRLMYHVVRKLRGERDRMATEDHKAQQFSVIDNALGQRFDPATKHSPDDERLIEMLLEPCQQLTDRQRQIARLGMMNYDTKDIAEELNVGVHVVYRELTAIRAAIDEERSQ